MATVLTNLFTGEAIPSMRYRQLLDVPDCPKCGQAGMQSETAYLAPRMMHERYGVERDGLLVQCTHCGYEIAVMDCKDRTLEATDGT